MLIQFPQTPGQQQDAENTATNDAFEAGLRRDLATAPVVLCGAMVGGSFKRAFDLTLTVLTAPVWAPVLLIAAGVAKLRHSAPVFQGFERIGYGGRPFQCWRLRINPPAAKIERLRQVVPEPETASNDWDSIEANAEMPRAKWRRALERLPQMINVLAGEMALVGPSPLSRAQVEPLKTAKRYYLSARPGVFGLSAITEDEAEESGQYKIYAVSWTLSMDLLIMWDAFRSLWRRGTLWRPGLKLPTQAAPTVVVRQRTTTTPAP